MAGTSLRLDVVAACLMARVARKEGRKGSESKYKKCTDQGEIKRIERAKSRGKKERVDATVTA